MVSSVGVSVLVRSGWWAGGGETEAGRATHCRLLLPPLPPSLPSHARHHLFVYHSSMRHQSLQYSHFLLCGQTPSTRRNLRFSKFRTQCSLHFVQLIQFRKFYNCVAKYSTRKCQTRFVYKILDYWWFQRIFCDDFFFYLHERQEWQFKKES